MNYLEQLCRYDDNRSCSISYLTVLELSQLNKNLEIEQNINKPQRSNQNSSDFGGRNHLGSWMLNFQHLKYGCSIISDCNITNIIH